MLDGLKDEVGKHIQKTRDEALAQVGKLQQRVQTMQEFSALNNEQKQEIEQSFHAIQTYIQNENLISSIRDRAGRYETGDYNSLLTRITGWAQKENGKPVEYVSQGELGVKFERAYLASEEDGDRYLEALKKAMLKAIKDNKRIQL